MTKTRAEFSNAEAGFSEVTFGGYDYPVVDAGTYVFELSQEIDQTSDNTWSDTQSVVVQAPRFRLPENAVVFRSPAKAAIGDFQNTLASILFDDPKLPWLRTSEVAGYGDLRAPWLQLTLFAPDELPRPKVGRAGVLSIDSGTHSANISIVDFMALHGRAASALGLTDAGNLIVPQLDISSSLVEDGNTTCKFIAVPAAQVLASLPVTQDMPYLAQTRVTAEGKRQAALMSNRFSQAVDGEQPFNRIAQVISVEQFWDDLDGSAQARTALEAKAAAGDVFCFISMAAWSFQNGGPTVSQDHFGELAQNLAQTSEDTARSLSFTHPITRTDLSGQTPELQGRFSSGYMPVPSYLVTQERSFAWYRGPLVPFETALYDPYKDPEPLADRFSDALVYDVRDGVFDLSLSGAWQIGRIMTLADQDLMVAWATVLRGLRLNVESEMRRARVGGVAVENATRAFVDVLQANGLRTDLTQGFNAPRKRKARSAQELRYPTQAETRKAIAQLDPQVLLSGMDQSALDVIIDKVARIIQLQGVPFHMLAPEPDYLPEESLRGFNIDPQWLGYLMDGALSVGLRKGVDHELYKLMRDAIWHLALAQATGRDDLAEGDSFVASGFLLRSYINQAWDDVTLTAYTGDPEDPASLVPIEVWREGRLAGGIKLWFFQERPDFIILAPPVGQLHLGVAQTRDIALRELNDGSLPVGSPIPGTDAVDITPYLREDGLTVAWWRDQGGLVEELARVLAAAGQTIADPGGAVPLPPQALAVQMLVSTPALELSVAPPATQQESK